MEKTYTTKILQEKLSNKIYLSLLLIVIGVVLTFFKDFDNILKTKNYLSLFGSFELSIVGILILVSSIKQKNKIESLKLTLSEEYIECRCEQGTYRFDPTNIEVKIELYSIKVNDDEHSIEINLNHFLMDKTKSQIKQYFSNLKL
jgi:uncharacterized membrane protein YbhN (UPF0104 family)